MCLLFPGRTAAWCGASWYHALKAVATGAVGLGFDGHFKYCRALQIQDFCRCLYFCPVLYDGIRYIKIPDQCLFDLPTWRGTSQSPRWDATPDWVYRHPRSDLSSASIDQNRLASVPESPGTNPCSVTAITHTIIRPGMISQDNQAVIRRVHGSDTLQRLSNHAPSTT